MRSAIIPAHFVPRYAGLVRRIRQGMQVLKALGPYAAIELLLPGGSVIALLLWLVRRRRTQGELTAAARSWPATQAERPPERAGFLEPVTARAAP
jgi:hypothetical protein